MPDSELILLNNDARFHHWGEFKASFIHQGNDRQGFPQLKTKMMREGKVQLFS